MAISASAKVLVDSSAWIEFFRKKEPYYRTVSRLIDEDRVVCIGLIHAELLQGAKSKKELAVLKDFIHAFDFLEESKELWAGAGELSFTLAKKGHKVGLGDCYIAVAAHQNKAEIITLDRHFKVIGEELKIVLVTA